MNREEKYNDGSFDSRFICHLSLVSETEEDTTILERNQAMYAVKAEKPTHYNLVGPRTISNCILFDPEDGLSKIFFVCTELGIRSPGKYRIRCNVIDSLKYNELISPTEGIYVDTANFQVYAPKDFPGIDGPTPLLKSFVLQGVGKAGRRYPNITGKR